MRQVDTTAKSTAAGIKQAFSGIGGLIAGGAILGGLKSVMDDFDKVAKVATRFGASAEDIQRVSVAAELAGVSIDTVARVLTKMSVAASEASTGNEAMAEAFKRAGINADQFKNSGLEQQLVMLSEAFNRARGDADATNQVIELMGTRAAGQMIPLIDNTAALRAEMAGVSVASEDVVRKIEAANDRMTRFFNDLKVGAAGAIGFITNTSERFGSLLGGAGFKTIAELEEIELRAQAIAQLTREGLFSKIADKDVAGLIAERMQEIQKRMEGVKNTSALINDDLETGNNLEKEKTSQLERQQQLLEQQEAKRKEAIKDAQFEVELIEAKLRGDKARVAVLEEQRDFERAMEQTGSFETAANVAATKAAERAAQDADRSAAGGSSSGATSGPRTALEKLRERAETDPSARAQMMRLNAEQARGMNRAGDMRERGMFGSSASAELRAERRAEQRAERFNTKQLATDRFGGGNMGEAFRNYSEQMRKQGEFAGSQKDFEKWAKEQAKSEKQREQEAASGGPAKSEKPSDPMSRVASDIADIKNVLTKADGIHDRLPIRVLAA
jgi:ribosomal protein L12E/L44/L45/RPP1/RPP2